MLRPITKSICVLSFIFASALPLSLIAPSMISSRTDDPTCTNFTGAWLGGCSVNGEQCVSDTATVSQRGCSWLTKGTNA